MRRLTTSDQVERMRKAWPTFRVLYRTRCDVSWKGELRPFCQTYTVQMQYHRALDRRNIDRYLPRVAVMNPLLHRRNETPREPIPHHYPNQHHPEFPFLCLYDPMAHEWHAGRSIAGTIVPWTIDWLACYEGWLATGEWTGGGRHRAAA